MFSRGDPRFCINDRGKEVEANISSFSSYETTCKKEKDTVMCPRTLLFFLVVAVVLGSRTITLKYFTDDNCHKGESIVKVNESECYVNPLKYSGLSWNCRGENVYLYTYWSGDQTCCGKPLCETVYPPGACVAQDFNQRYIIASGC